MYYKDLLIRLLIHYHLEGKVPDSHVGTVFSAADLEILNFLDIEAKKTIDDLEK